MPYAPGFCVVMPSIREFPIEYLEPLLPHVMEVIVVDDSNGAAKRPPLPRNVKIVDYDFQEKYLPGASAIIPRGNPSCKDFGLYYAWKEGYSGIILLDDDCDTRVSPDYVDQIPILQFADAVPFTTKSGWYNTMVQLGEWNTYARGYPYEHRDEPLVLWHDQKTRVYSVFNEGLWTGTADINGIDKLIGKEATGDRGCHPPLVLIGQRQKLPLSIMNVQLGAELVPAFYQPPDYKAPNGFRVRRHDDVWSMYVLKTLINLRNEFAMGGLLHSVTVGKPIVLHTKEGDMLKEIASEHTTNLIQGQMTRLVDVAAMGVEPGTYAQMAYQLGGSMLALLGYANPPMAYGAFKEILKEYASGIMAWARLFDPTLD